MTPRPAALVALIGCWTSESLAAEPPPGPETNSQAVAPATATEAPAPAQASPEQPSNAAPRASEAGANHDALRAEIAELRSELDGVRAEMGELRDTSAQTSAAEKKLDLYGFIDMGLQRVWSGPRAATSGTGSPRAATFALGNVNLYVDATPTAGWRGLVELRLTNYPNGALTRAAVPALGVEEARENTTVFDVNQPDPGWNQVSWSGFVLEQAWIQGTLTDWFGVRVGYFLTPFGIWNIDHGSPTLIGLRPPQFTRGHFYPDHQLGLQILGQVSEGSWTYAYVGYVSNGKTQGALDPTSDKAFGGRLSAATTRPFPIAFGVAGYGGRYSQTVAEVNPDAPLAITEREAVAYRQSDVGADVSMDIDRFRFRLEGVVERIEYEEGKRETVYGIPGTQWPDRTLWGAYAVAAYRLPWLGLEPYVAGELYRYPTPLSEAAASPGIGLNIHFTTETQLKTQYSSIHFFDFDGTPHSEHDTSILASRLVMAF